LKFSKQEFRKRLRMLKVFSVAREITPFQNTRLLISNKKSKSVFFVVNTKKHDEDEDDQ